MDKKAPVSISILISQESVSCLQALADTGLFGIGGAHEVASRFVDERIQHYVREGWLPSRDFVPRGKPTLRRRRS